MSLTAKQRAFVEHYIQSWNATEAAREAGYKGSYTTLRSVGSENLTKPNIQDAIAERVSEMVVDADEALVRLAEQVRGPDLGELAKAFLIYEQNADQPVRLPLVMKQLERAGLSRYVKRIRETRTGLDIEFHDSQAALFKVLQVLQIDKHRIDLTSGGEKIAGPVILPAVTLMQDDDDSD